jgi:hypothetical protein
MSAKQGFIMLLFAEVSRSKYAKFREGGRKFEIINERTFRVKVCPGATRQAALKEQLSKHGFERHGDLYSHALFRQGSDSWKQILSKRQKEAAAAKASEKTSGDVRKRAASMAPEPAPKRRKAASESTEVPLLVADWVKTSLADHGEAIKVITVQVSIIHHPFKRSCVVSYSAIANRPYSAKCYANNDPLIVLHTASTMQHSNFEHVTLTAQGAGQERAGSLQGYEARLKRIEREQTEARARERARDAEARRQIQINEDWRRAQEQRLREHQDRINAFAHREIEDGAVPQASKSGNYRGAARPLSENCRGYGSLRDRPAVYYR